MPKLTVPAALVAVDVPSGEGDRLGEHPDERVRPGTDRPLPSRFDVQGRDDVRLPHPGHHDPGVEGPLPGHRDGRRREFHNYAGESTSGTPTFFQDFTVSCNTAFVGLSGRLGDDDLSASARPSASARAGATSSASPGRARRQRPEHHGRHGCRRGRDRSGPRRGLPLSLAVMSGSIGRSTFVPPVLVEDPDGPARPTPLDGGAVADIRSMMSSVVASGTGTALRGVPGGRSAARRGRRTRQRPRRAAARVVHGVPGRRGVRGARRGGQERRHRRRTDRQGLPHLPGATDRLPRPSLPEARQIGIPRRVPPLLTGKVGAGTAGPARHPDGAFAKTQGTRVQMGRTVGLRTLGPCVTSNSTRWASSRLR